MTAALSLFPSATAEGAAAVIPIAKRVRFWVGAGSLFITVLLGSLLVWAVLPALLQPWNTSVVMSGSMEPRLRTGDAVVWRTEVPDQLPENAVVIYSQGERTVIHRAIDHPTADTYITKGDANATPDSDPVHTNQLRGIGQLLVPIVGLPMVWWSNGQHLAVILLGLLLLAALWTAHRAWDPEHDPWHEAIAVLHPGTRDRDALLVSSSEGRRRPIPDLPNSSTSSAGALLPPEVRAALLGSERATT